MRIRSVLMAFVFLGGPLLWSQQNLKDTYCHILWYATVMSAIPFDPCKSDSAVSIQCRSNWLVTFKVIRYYRDGQWHSSREDIIIGLRELYSQLGIDYANIDYSPDYYLVFLDEHCKKPLNVVKASLNILDALEIEIEEEARET